MLLCLSLWSCKVGRETVVQGKDQRWDALSFGDKMTYMTDVVSPEMKRRFQAFDAERFADFSCATCHGSGVDDGTYAMPNPDLPHLREKGFYKEHRKTDPEIVKFMWNGVEKPVAQMLGQSAGHSGELDCWTCHVIDDRHP